ncbi:glycosyltransferase [Thermosynechococcus sp. PP45]|uniref:glycosyltransferase n=1 Tax=unclassified Thermosynechococcus TaxID=2622553 RepID=UPI0026726F12|nr:MULTISPECIES: glycosyltransferase [unclassified Thermosynechococcus]MDR7921771.1 glycosyltransferase [Thermosynechococcus sp. HY213]WKT82330.1 glycosyltransferase [Thermosynechococcus sp. PP45]WNC25947.1 glycosyltransferase [Thermosynechococcus sp. PP551]WNC28527.1 glycosyltransferase [Thermosynechococcus sp. PP555]
MTMPLVLTLILLSVTGLSLVIWLVLLLFWGQFWRPDQRLQGGDLRAWPRVVVVIPARNEAAVIGTSVRSLLEQDYAGTLHLILVDDQSNDGTGDIARQTALELGKGDRLTVIEGTPLPSGWSGKLWALSQGIEAARAFDPDYLLLTDADIAHDRQNLRQLVAHARQQNCALVSLMVKLRCQSIWEKLLIPAFVFFFAKLYPFRWVNDPQRSTAAAAGGCILIDPLALDKIGGIACIRDALIDDCSLAAAVKRAGYRIWLGLTPTTVSLRAYNTLSSIWQMVARTAYTQLSYSPLLLVGTVIGMTLVYLWAPLALAIGLIGQSLPLAVMAGLTWGSMAIAYGPTVRFYGLNRAWALTLPVIAFLYTLMTLDSARRHWQGRGGAWKGRVYPRKS